MEPVIGVLALQGDVREHLRALRSTGARARSIRRASELDDVAGLVIPGGESTTMSKLAIEYGLLEPVAKLIADGLPAYGSCAGMIMLATQVLDGRPDQRSFGGIDMTVRRNAFGRQVDSFEASVALSGIAGEPFRAVFIRAPWVERIGPEVVVLGRVGGLVADGAQPGEAGEAPEGGDEVARRAGRSPAGRIVAVRQGDVLATAFHPELTGDLRVHRLFVEMVRGGWRGDGRGARDTEV